jgi:hypothetical protein
VRNDSEAEYCVFCSLLFPWVERGPSYSGQGEPTLPRVLRRLRRRTRSPDRFP